LILERLPDGFSSCSGCIRHQGSWSGSWVFLPSLESSILAHIWEFFRLSLALYTE
jgi:hypothetical protein